MNESYSWYQALSKPTWAPPSWLFGPVWTVLYTIIAVTFGTVFYRAFMGKIPWIVALPFALNLVFNAAFTPLQFWLKNNLLASIDILLVLGTLVWALCALYSFGLKLHIETGTPTFLVKLLTERQFFTPDLGQVLAEEKLLSSFDVNDIATEALGIYAIASETLVGNDEARRLAWMRSHNDALNGVPASLVLSAQGLVAAVAYLDAMRAPI